VRQGTSGSCPPGAGVVEETALSPLGQDNGELILNIDLPRAYD
jgi:hypothetical protein